MGYKSIGIIFMTCLMACNGDYAQKNVAKMMQADTLICQQEGDQVVINYTDSGKLKAKIKVKKLLGYKKEGNEILKMPMGVKGEFYNVWIEKLKVGINKAKINPSPIFTNHTKDKKLPSHLEDF